MKRYFELPAEDRNAFIDAQIMPRFPASEWAVRRKVVVAIVDAYAGVDESALYLLQQAAERGRFDEFVDRMQKHLDAGLKYVRPESRQTRGIIEADQTRVFFKECYAEMGVEP